MQCHDSGVVACRLFCSTRGRLPVQNHLCATPRKSSLMMMMMLWLEARKKRVQEWTLFFPFSQSIFDDNTDLLKSEVVQHWKVEGLSLSLHMNIEKEKKNTKNSVSINSLPKELTNPLYKHLEKRKEKKRSYLLNSPKGDKYLFCFCFCFSVLRYTFQFV